VTDHVHVRPQVAGDMARLARIESHTAVGLVFAGGGARGLAHIGVYRALVERGIDVDYVGGTSIGALMAVLVASNGSVGDVTEIARKWFSTNPTGDFNLLPVLSLIKGRRMRRAIDGALVDLLGFDPDVEDLWKNFFCVASNYTRASEQAIRRGNQTTSGARAHGGSYATRADTAAHSTVTDFARLRGWSTSQPRRTAM